MQCPRLSPFATLAVCACLAGVAFATGPLQHAVYTFPGQPNAAGPTSTLIADAAGNLYGTTAEGGTSENCIWSGGGNPGCGAVFELSPASGGRFTETVLYSFQDLSDGGVPYGGLVMDAAGNLYGAAAVGGSGFEDFPGTIYELSPPAEIGGTWAFTKLYTFQSSSSTDGSGPYGTLIFDHAGNLYGTTYGGGTSNEGTVFELSPPSSSGGSWTEAVLHSFSGADGSGPMAGLYMDAAGNLYGTTVYGGNFTADFCQGSGCGVAFKLLPGSADTWTELVLHTFDLTDGRNPYGGLTFYHGNFYGTVSDDRGFVGSVFELTPGHGGPWTFTTIHDFGGPDDGTAPYSGLIVDAHGNLYGTTSGGGSGTGGGTVYKLSPPAATGDPWTETVLTSFAFAGNNSDPIGGLLLRGNRLYGTNSACQGQFFLGCSISGTVFAITDF
jgi:uncharacterized repeat protein (TIGR03803 family)